MNFIPCEGTADSSVLATAGEVEIVRELGDDERDLAEVGRMFRVRNIATGNEADAFGDELMV